MAELLAPAGDMEKLKTAFHYGADAVYLGGKAFNLRAQSHNFSKDAIVEAVNYAHSLGRKVYVALNIIAHDKEIKALPGFVKFLETAGVDAVIVADMGVLDIVTEVSDIPIHISTQASTTNWRTVKMWQKLGAKRVVLARECSIAEMRKIKENVPDVELEVFVHGAMCMAYSGRCMISQYMSERDGNRGACANACRWKYSVQEEKRPGEYFPVYEDDTGSYLYNSKDLCTIEYLDQILATGVDGLKIEGRMKTIYYNATVTRIYKQALEAYNRGQWAFDPEWLSELKSVSHRQYTTGFYLGKLDRHAQNLSGAYERTREFVGVVREDRGDGRFLVEIRGRNIRPGDPIEALDPNGKVHSFAMPAMKSEKTGEALEAAHPSSLVEISLDLPLQTLDIFRRGEEALKADVGFEADILETSTEAQVF